MNDLKIHICMGSSCYARGNAHNAELAKKWLSGHPDSGVELTGTLCEGRCKDGPVLRLGEAVSTKVSPESLDEILRKIQGD